MVQQNQSLSSAAESGHHLQHRRGGLHHHQQQQPHAAGHYHYYSRCFQVAFRLGVAMGILALLSNNLMYYPASGDNKNTAHQQRTILSYENRGANNGTATTATATTATLTKAANGFSAVDSTIVSPNNHANGSTTNNGDTSEESGHQGVPLKTAPADNNPHYYDFSPSQNYSIFYNAYIPPAQDNAALDQTVAMIRGQLKLVQRSAHKDATVYYNLIGHDYYNQSSSRGSSGDRGDTPSSGSARAAPAPPSGSVSSSTAAMNISTTSGDLCPPGLDCRFLRYYPKAFEDVTLSAIYEYCHVYPRHRVIYLHDKGSYHGTRSNHMKRTQLTVAVTSHACKQMHTFQNSKQLHTNNDSATAKATAATKCNVCSSRFQPLPHWHTMGNMWMAECSYIRKLLPPKVFARRKEALYDDLFHPDRRDEYYCLREHLDAREGRVKSMEEYRREFGNAGRLKMDRFLWENWVWSHPDVVPCDVVGGNALGKAPFKSFETIPTRRWGRNEFFRLKGLLHQFRFLYNGTEPDASSWFWGYYGKTARASPPCRRP